MSLRKKSQSACKKSNSFRKSHRHWPEWWDWELELSPHLEKRMVDRDFNEIDLRTMLEKAKGFHPDVIEGRWVIETKHHRQAWEVIVEPDPDEQLLVIITAYPVYRGR